VGIEIRGIDAAELRQVVELDGMLYGYAVEDEGYGSLFEAERVLAAFDGGRMVGSSSALSLELTLPGGARVPMAGVTWVGVLATHRRRGLMRRLVCDQLARMEQTGEPVAGLGASQSLLYRRFGFGPATRTAHVEVETQHARFSEPFVDGGSLGHADLDEALDLVSRLHAELCRAGRNGMVRRPVAMHRYSYREAAKEKDGAGPTQFVVHRDAEGEVDGIVTYRFKLAFDPGELYEGELRVIELLARNDGAAAALWRHCLDYDLARRVVVDNAPVDEPAADRLADPRRWVVRPRDDLHLRPHDIPALLGVRRYQREDAVTIEVQDPLFERCGGRFRVEGGLDGASCTRVDTSPDLVLGTAALGSMLLGDAPVERLHRAGLVEEHTPGAVRRATAMFAWSPLPWASYLF